MKPNWENIFKEIGIILITTMGMFLVISLFQDCSTNMIKSFNDYAPVTGLTVIAILIGLFTFNHFSKRLMKKGWGILILVDAITIGLGGMLYSITPFSLGLVGLATPGILMFITPTNISAWKFKFFGLDPQKRYLIPIAFALFVVIYTPLSFGNATQSLIPAFSIIMLVFGILWGVWLMWGQRFGFPFKNFEGSVTQPTTEFYAPKLIVTLITVIGWNFVFLMLVEFWDHIIRIMYTTTLEVNAQTLGTLLLPLFIGLGLTILVQIKFPSKTSTGFKISLLSLIIFFVFTVLLFFNAPAQNSPENLAFLFIALIALPILVGGVFQCAPFEYHNPLLVFIRNVFIFVDAALFIISSMILPQLLTVIGRNTLFPTVYLFNLIFLSFMFILNILRFTEGDKLAALPPEPVQPIVEGRIDDFPKEAY